MKEKVQQLMEEALAENEALFLVDWSISVDNKIKVLVDSDDNLPLEEIIRISRHIEHNLDREELDFALEVSSSGIGNGLVIPRQYKKNIGRTLTIRMNDDTEFEGKLSEANENDFTIQWKQREPKPVGKGKHTVEKTKTIEYNQIKKAIVKITF